MLVPQSRGLLLSVLNYLIEAGVGGDGVRIEPQKKLSQNIVILLYNNILNSDITVLIYMKIFYGNVVIL